MPQPTRIFRIGATLALFAALLPALGRAGKELDRRRPVAPEGVSQQPRSRCAWLSKAATEWGRSRGLAVNWGCRRARTFDFSLN